MKNGKRRRKKGLSSREKREKNRMTIGQKIDELIKPSHQDENLLFCSDQEAAVALKTVKETLEILPEHAEYFSSLHCPGCNARFSGDPLGLLNCSNCNKLGYTL